VCSLFALLLIHVLAGHFLAFALRPRRIQRLTALRPRHSRQHLDQLWVLLKRGKAALLIEGSRCGRRHPVVEYRRHQRPILPQRDIRRAAERLADFGYDALYRLWPASLYAFAARRLDVRVAEEEVGEGLDPFFRSPGPSPLTTSDRYMSSSMRKVANAAGFPSG